MAGVLIVGATGFIGRAVAQAVRRNGFTAFAQTRSDAKAKALAADELIPVVCDPKDVATMAAAVSKCEFVIDCSADYSAETSTAIQAAMKEATGDGPNKVYVYTSGCLVHGDNPGRLVTEDTFTDHPMAAWRIELEKQVIASEDVDGTVIRPGFVYGRTGGFVGGMVFDSAKEGKLVIDGKPDKRWSWVHCDDLADAYVRVLTRRAAAKGRIYDIGEPFGPEFRELLVAGARINGFPEDGEIVAKEAEGFMAFMDVSTVVNPKRACDELGWAPTRTGILAELDLYYAAWKAAQA